MKEVNGARTYFVSADEGLIAEANAAGEITKTYGWQPDGIWGTDPVWMRVENSTTEANGYHWFQNDHLGTPQKLTSANGAVTWSATYDAFGKATVDTANSTVVNNLRFPGQYADAETGLHYNWHRYYDPKTGRYSTSDPLGLNGGLNLYQYGLGAPTRYIDPWGLKVYRCCRDTEINRVVDGAMKVLRQKHCFIKTDTKEAGMGPQGNGPLPSYPIGKPTEIVDHTGQSEVSECVEIPDADESCVNDSLEIGKSCGRWTPWNNCNTVADDILEKCKKKSCDTDKEKQ